MNEVLSVVWRNPRNLANTPDCALLLIAAAVMFAAIRGALSIPHIKA
jgi:hypothetical protein